jgi:hypothetical protein
MVVGAYALAYYGRVRATLDIDIAVYVKPEDFEEYLDLLADNNFSYYLENPNNPCFLVLDDLNSAEIEVWRELDGVDINEEVLKRRRRITTPNGWKLWIIGPENLIVNKLARPDRRAVDETDVASIFEDQKDHLDYEYLYNEASQAKVLGLLKAIQNSINTSR